MKTILTLLLSFGVFAAFAQTDAEKEEAKRVILGDRKDSGPVARRDDDRTIILGGDDRTVYGKRNNRYPNTYGSSREQRQIDAINRAYNEKIYSIRNNRTLSRSEKERIIRQLEADRRRSIDQLRNNRYDDNRFGDNRSRYEKSKKYKGNNGNHYGWEKGKGNPHHGN